MGGAKLLKKVKRSVYPKTTTKKEVTSKNPDDLAFNPFDSDEEEEKNTPKRSTKKAGVKKMKQLWEKKIHGSSKTDQLSLNQDATQSEAIPQLSPITVGMSETSETSSKQEKDIKIKVTIEDAPVNPYGISEVGTDQDEDNMSTMSPLTFHSGQFKAQVIDVSDYTNDALKLPSLGNKQDDFKEAEGLVYGESDNNRPSPPLVVRRSGGVAVRQEPDDFEQLMEDFNNIEVDEAASGAEHQDASTKASTMGQADNPIDLTDRDYRLLLSKPADAVSVGMVEDADEAYEEMIQSSHSMVTKTTYKLFGPNGTWYYG